MRTITTTVYNYNELSNEAKKAAVEKYRGEVLDAIMEGYGDDYEGTLRKLAEATGFKAVDWSVDYCGYHNSVKVDRGNYDTMLDYYSPDEITGRLLFRYVNRAIMPNIAKGKYYSTGHRWIDGHFHYRYRYSRVINQYDNCTLTGMCYELNFEDKLIHYYEHWNEYPQGYSLQDLMNDCYNAFFKAWHSEYEYFGDEDEGIIEHFEANEWEFTENGIAA